MRHKVWLDAGDRFALGDGGIGLLRAIEATGSIRAAAREVGWSYRHALAYLDNADAVLGRTLVDRARGGMERGGARLTPEGARLVRRYDAFRQRLDAAFLRLTRSTFMMTCALVILTGLLLLAGPGELAAQAQRPPVILSTTTSTQDSGLLDLLVPMFERQSGFSVKTVAVGTGQALGLAARGEADVVLAHAPELEKKYVAEDKLRNRRLVMYNDFVIIGPADDPAKIKAMTSAAHAMKAIAQAGARFVSRGDNSGTNILEKSLWKLAGVEPSSPWYIESGQGMGLTLGLADDRNAYTLTDRGTYLAYQKRLRLPILLQGDRPLLNIYSVMEANPANGPRVHAAGGKAFADFLVATETQTVIKTFGVDRYGQPLFVPIAGTTEDRVGVKP